MLDTEFGDVVAPTERLARGNSTAVGHVDLLTVVMHLSSGSAIALAQDERARHEVFGRLQEMAHGGSHFLAQVAEPDRRRF